MTWLPPSSKHPPPASAAKADADADGDGGDGSGDATADDAEEDGAQVDRDGVSQKDWVSSPLGSSLPLPRSPSSATRCARGSSSICCSTRRASSPRRVSSLFRLFSIYGTTFSKTRNTGELGNNTMMGASCGVGSFSAVSTSREAALTVPKSHGSLLLGIISAASRLVDTAENGPTAHEAPIIVLFPSSPAFRVFGK